MNRTGDALPQDAFFLPQAEAENLQSALDKYKRVRLSPAGHYTRAKLITIRSGYELYGFADTRIPKVIIEEGTSGAILRGVAPDGWEFPPSRNITQHNCFEHINANYFQQPLKIQNTKLTDNLFLNIFGNIFIDMRGGGYIQNNRFIGLLVHSVSPSLTIYGDPERKSHDNIFLWADFLVPHGDTIYISNQKNINFVGIDAESWNSRGKASRPAMMTVRNSGVVRVFMPHGGDYKGREGKYFDVGADEFQIAGLWLGRSGKPATILRPQNLRLATFLSQNRGFSDMGLNRFSLKVLEDSRAFIEISGKDALTHQITSEEEAAIKEMFTSGYSSAVPWERPILPLIPDPAGRSWGKDLGSQKDSTQYIQHLIDTNGIANLEPGTYYISSPLRLERGQGIIGAGASRTAIVAKNPTIDIIVGNDHLEDRASTYFVLADITLQGGRNGIHHMPDGSGRGAQYNRVHLSHVTFRDMSVAGIFLDGIYGWDNNFLDNINFYHCPIGIKQRPPVSYISPVISGDVAGMTYFDKNVCYRCQFVGGRKGVELLTKRQNNFNAFINSEFRDNSEYALEMKRTVSTVIANTLFKDNKGDPVIKSDRAVGCVSCRFETTSFGISMLDNNSICEGCTFTSIRSSQAAILKQNSQAILINSASDSMPLGNPSFGFLLNSELKTDLGADQFSMLIRGKRVSLLVNGTPHAIPQLLAGSVFR